MKSSIRVRMVKDSHQSMANELSLKKNLILLCGHYKGVDERVREHLDYPGNQHW